MPWESHQKKKKRHQTTTKKEGIPLALIDEGTTVFRLGASQSTGQFPKQQHKEIHNLQKPNITVTTTVLHALQPFSEHYPPCVCLVCWSGLMGGEMEVYSVTRTQIIPYLASARAHARTHAHVNTAVLNACRVIKNTHYNKLYEFMKIMRTSDQSSEKHEQKNWKNLGIRGKH